MRKEDGKGAAVPGLVTSKLTGVQNTNKRRKVRALFSSVSAQSHALAAREDPFDLPVEQEGLGATAGQTRRAINWDCHLAPSSVT